MDSNQIFLSGFTDTATAFVYKSNRQLRKAQFLFFVINNSMVATLGIELLRISLACRFPVKGLIRATIFEHFCGGESIKDAEQTALSLSKYQVLSVLDYSVEGLQNDAGFDATTTEIIKNFNIAKTTSCIPFCVFKPTGVANIDLLAKIQRREFLTEAEQLSFSKVKHRFEKIAQAAQDTNVPMLIDAEESWIQDVVDDIAYDLMRSYNNKQTLVYNTYQMYRHDMLERLEKAIAQAQAGKYRLGVKLVRGAYMEKERKRAQEMGYPNLICDTKQQTDFSFDNGLSLCVEHLDSISLLCCTHNEKSVVYLLSLMKERNIATDDKRIWFGQLLGMSDNISFNLAKRGFYVLKYMPYGPILSLIPYLIRRAEENISVRGQMSRELNMINAELRRRKQIRLKK